MAEYHQRISNINIPITEKQHRLIEEYLPFGMRGKVWNQLVAEAIIAFEKDPGKFLIKAHLGLLAVTYKEKEDGSAEKDGT